MRSIRSLPTRPPRKHYVSTSTTSQQIYLQNKLNKIESRINYTLTGQLVFSLSSVAPSFSEAVKVHIEQYMDPELFSSGTFTISMLFMSGTLLCAAHSAILAQKLKRLQ